MKQVIGLTPNHKQQLHMWVGDFSKTTDTTYGIMAGLNWVVDKLGIRNLLDVEGVSELVIDDSIVEECLAKINDNYIQAVWNKNFARAVYSVTEMLGLVNFSMLQEYRKGA